MEVLKWWFWNDNVHSKVISALPEICLILSGVAGHI